MNTNTLQQSKERLMESISLAHHQTANVIFEIEKGPNSMKLKKMREYLSRLETSSQQFRSQVESSEFYMVRQLYDESYEFLNILIRMQRQIITDTKAKEEDAKQIGCTSTISTAEYGMQVHKQNDIDGSSVDEEACEISSSTEPRVVRLEEKEVDSSEKDADSVGESKEKMEEECEINTKITNKMLRKVRRDLGEIWNKISGRWWD